MRKNEGTLPYYIGKDVLEPEEYTDYECFNCGIFEDEEDFRYPEREEAGIVIPSNGFEIYLCGSCKLVFKL